MIHKFCKICTNILTIEEMDNPEGICNSCKEKDTEEKEPDFEYA